MAAEQRVLIEELFGRDISRHRNHVSGLTDARLCRSFIVGTCPFDMFTGTKEDLGSCKSIHLEQYKIMYEAEKKKYDKKVREKLPLTKEDLRTKSIVEEFEHDYMTDLEYHIKDVNHKIKMAEDKLRHTPEEQAKIDRITLELDDMDIRIGLMTQEIELLAANHELIKSLEISDKLDELLVQRGQFAKTIRDISDNIGQAGQQKLEVCSICAAYLSRLDSDRRLGDHFLGKIHLSYVQMRKTLQELRSKSR